MSFHPYLFFGGNCREAFTRYKEIFGGELAMMSMADAPSDQPIPAMQHMAEQIRVRRCIAPPVSGRSPDRLPFW